MTATTSLSTLDTELQRLTARTLSPAARYGHVALLLIALAMSVLLAALLATEPALPARTRAAFTAMLLIGGGWIAYSTWVLRQRRPLMAQHRVVAGVMSVVFTGAFFASALVAALVTNHIVAATAAVAGATLLALAIAVLIQARRRVEELQTRRRELERLLGQGA